MKPIWHGGGGGGDGGDGGGLVVALSSLARMLGRMFDHSFPASGFFVFVFVFLK